MILSPKYTEKSLNINDLSDLLHHHQVTHISTHLLSSSPLFFSSPLFIPPLNRNGGWRSDHDFGTWVRSCLPLSVPVDSAPTTCGSAPSSACSGSQHVSTPGCEGHSWSTTTPSWTTCSTLR